MKTAMQEWFDELKANYPYMANEIYQKGFEKYLEKEKEQICNSYVEGLEGLYMGAEEYYNKTYNQKTSPCVGHDTASWEEEDKLNKRIDIIGQNGNEGTHYEENK
jgi:hypothetical protein